MAAWLQWGPQLGGRPESRVPKVVASKHLWFWAPIQHPSISLFPKKMEHLGRGVPVSSLFTPFSSSKGLGLQLPTARLPAAPPGGCPCWRRAGGVTNGPLARQERTGDKQRPQEGRRAFLTLGGFAALGTYEEETHTHGDRRRPASEGEQPRHHALSSARPGPQRAARGRGEGGAPGSVMKVPSGNG